MSQKHVPISSALIRAKAKKIFDHINKDSDSSFDFQASKDIDASLRELKTSSINACWKNLWSEVVVKENHLPPITNQEQEIMELAHQIECDGFEHIRQDEIYDLIVSHGANRRRAIGNDGRQTTRLRRR
ncbi:hypothetical protein QE152_g4484 [Popillia japonica]|uniref:Uncharacterized protein n=1 Tax=Popillia japonica TaxID=7064 RepID=A0AAW1MVI7_POPJA